MYIYIYIYICLYIYIGWDTSSVETSSIPFQSPNPNTFNPTLKVREHPILGPYVEGIWNHMILHEYIYVYYKCVNKYI
jgi:hypothetical protein